MFKMVRSLSLGVARASIGLLAILLFLGCSGREFDEAELKKFSEAQVLFRNRKFDDAEKILLPLRTSKKGNAEAGVLHAKIKFFVRDFKAAEEILREVLKENKDSPYVEMWLGQVVLIDPNRQEEAAEIFRRILRRDPDNFAAHYFLGRSLENQQKIRLAIMEYQASLAQEYQISKIHLHMVRLFSELDMQERARQHRDRLKAIGANPSDIADADELPGPGKPPRKGAKK